MDKPESIFSFLAALLTAIGSFLGLLRISPDWFPAFGKSSISSINSKFEETTKLESNLEGRGESAIRLRKKGLADEALETLSYKIYMRDGIRFISNRGKVGCGCISCCLIGFEIGIAAVLLLLSCAFSQEEDEDTAKQILHSFYCGYSGDIDDGEGMLLDIRAHSIESSVSPLYVESVA